MAINKNLLELVRISIPHSDANISGRASVFFDILENTQNLTEEFIYAHQPLSEEKIKIYSTSPDAVGEIDYSVAIENQFKIVFGPAIIVARKGYAGRLYKVDDERFIVHEDAYPVKPKEEYADRIDLVWFVGHYNEEFQANRTSPNGIGDFPRTRFNNMTVIVPEIGFQKRAGTLYEKRGELIKRLSSFKGDILAIVDDQLSKAVVRTKTE